MTEYVTEISSPVPEEAAELQSLYSPGLTEPEYVLCDTHQPEQRSDAQRPASQPYREAQAETEPEAEPASPPAEKELEIAEPDNELELTA